VGGSIFAIDFQLRIRKKFMSDDSQRVTSSFVDVLLDKTKFLVLSTTLAALAAAAISGFVFLEANSQDRKKVENLRDSLAAQNSELQHRLIVLQERLNSVEKSAETNLQFSDSLRKSIDTQIQLLERSNIQSREFMDRLMDIQESQKNITKRPK
jgi:hypothetical protein